MLGGVHGGAEKQGTGTRVQPESGGSPNKVSAAPHPAVAVCRLQRAEVFHRPLLKDISCEMSRRKDVSERSLSLSLFVVLSALLPAEVDTIKEDKNGAHPGVHDIILSQILES